MSLTVSQLSKRFGIHQVLNNISFTLNAGERVGLVGANGVGKSTALKIMTGQLEADSGEVTLAPHMQLGHLEQAIHFPSDATVTRLIDSALAYVRGLEAKMRQLEVAMAAADENSLSDIMQTYGQVMEEFENRDGYDMDYRVEIILQGLRVAHIARDRLFASLSGGEKARFGLAFLLLRAPDILLLDEPTNHLDHASLTWLEQYLQGYKGAVLIVSHDRQFLNGAVNAIIEINEHTRSSKRYSGNYDTYQQAKIMERRKWQLDFARQQEEIKQLHIEIKEVARRNDNYRPVTDGDKFIKWTKSQQHDTTVAKRVRSAQEKLNRIQAEPIPQPPEDLRFQPDFDPDALQGRTPLFVSGLSKTYGERIILRDIHFTLGMKSRVVLVGPNGAGKSTLLRLLAGVEAPDAGTIQTNPAVRTGYLDQEQKLLDPTATLFEAYSQNLTGSQQQLKATLLQSGLFHYDELDKRIHELSAGQQRKVQIARLIADRVNLLILDEPTNYISFDVLESLENALREFAGPVIAASHDRRFIQQFNGVIWEITAGSITQHISYNDYILNQSQEPVSVFTL